MVGAAGQTARDPQPNGLPATTPPPSTIALKATKWSTAIPPPELTPDTECRRVKVTPSVLLPRNSAARAAAASTDATRAKAGIGNEMHLSKCF